MSTPSPSLTTPTYSSPSTSSPSSLSISSYPLSSTHPLPTSLPSLLDRPLPKSHSLVSLSLFSYLFSELVQYSYQRIDHLSDLESRLSSIGYQVGLRSLELCGYRFGIQQFLTSGGGGGGSGASGQGGYSSSGSQYSLSSSTLNSSTSSSFPSSSSTLSSTPFNLQTIASIHGKKEKNLIQMLQYLHSVLWKYLFGRIADGLEKSTDKEDEYYIYDNSPITNKFISSSTSNTSSSSSSSSSTSTSQPSSILSQFNPASFCAGIINGILDGSMFTCEVSAHFNQNYSTGITRTVYVIKFAEGITKRDTS